MLSPIVIVLLSLPITDLDNVHNYVGYPSTTNMLWTNDDIVKENNDKIMRLILEEQIGQDIK